MWFIRSAFSPAALSTFCRGIVNPVDWQTASVTSPGLINAGCRTAARKDSLDSRPDCVITLRGERVKLRLIQPRDWVRVKHTEHFGACVADAIKVQSGGPAPS